MEETITDEYNEVANIMRMFESLSPIARAMVKKKLYKKKKKF